MTRWLAIWMLLGAGSAMADEISVEQREFFRSRIEPILIDRCYDCHSHQAETAGGGLVLDSAGGIRTGGSRGPALVPGSPEESLLLTAIRQTGALKMPPEDADDKLSDRVIGDFQTWIAQGAPDPRPTDTASGAKTLVVPARDWQRAAQHWAYRPIVKPTITAESSAAIDMLIGVQLQSQDLSFNPPAERRALLRRLTYGLTGLPPTLAQIQSFVDDKSAAALQTVVERLLDSAEYGEHWGRHWLDVARYADTRGYLAGGRQQRYSFSHVYRDYVIDAFNDDKPYDQFLVEQLAADKLDLGPDNSALAALGFLTLGRRFNGDNNLVLDDRIDVVTRGLMGTTVTCARCHDHKFDPIPTEDYYSIYGVFAASTEPSELPLIEALTDRPEYRSYLAARAEIERQIANVTDAKILAFQAEHRSKLGDYLLAAHDARSLLKTISLEEFAGQRGVDIRLLKRWINRLAPSEPAHPVWVNWFGVLGRETTVEPNPEVNRAFVIGQPDSPEAAAELYNELSMAAQKDPSANPQLSDYLRGEDCPSNAKRSEVQQWLNRIIRDKTARHRRELEALNWMHDGAPRRAPVLVDRKNPANPHIFRRGDPRNPGEEVPRRFLRFLAGPDREPFADGSGRLELAQAIVDPTNPLTARVFVNRVWAWHFGRPLVDTSSDFGVRTPAPTQHRLLDWLAATLIEDGWSIKTLHRHIVLSQTYQQSSQVRPRAQSIDPENRLWHHFPRRRLGFEEMRDSLLFASGNLDSRRGGVSTEMTKYPSPPRRSVYGFIDRQNLPGLLRTFDFPSPDATSPGRYQTTVPGQALFLMNSPFAVAQAASLAERVVAEQAGVEPRVRFLYRHVFQREPDDSELALASKFLSVGSHERGNWDLLVQALLASNEFLFVD